MSDLAVLPPRWRYASASALGTSHVGSGTPCQDACACEVVTGVQQEEILIAVACDGAGSASLSHIGATETCRFFLDYARELLATGGSPEHFSRSLAVEVTLKAQTNLRRAAEAAGAGIRDLACTLLVGIVSPQAATFIQVGDGVLVVGPRSEPPNEFSWIFWPERGEYANTTTFLSDENLVEHIQHTTVCHAIDELAVLTDGIQNLVLDYKGQTAHSPFFSRMLAPLRSHEESGHAESLSSALSSYLNSPVINERTDDDKTLILASRRAPIGQ